MRYYQAVNTSSKTELRFGVVGVGYFGKHYVRLLRDFQGASLYAVTERSTPSTLDIATDVGRYSSARELFDDPSIDCVIIATPSVTHAQFAEEALRKGKHVLVEKPMATTFADAEHLARIAETSGRVYMIGHQYCYNDHIEALRKALEKDMCGTIRSINAEHIYPGPMRSDIGCLWETATHELAIIDYLFPHATVSSISGRMIDITGNGHDDATSATITFDTGMVLTLYTTWCAPQKSRRMILIGESGSIQFDESESIPLRFAQHQSRREAGSTTSGEHSVGDPLRVPARVREPLFNSLTHFIECVHTAKEPRTGVTHGLRITSLLDRITTTLS